MTNDLVLRVAKKQLNGVEVVNNVAQKDSADKIRQLISGDYFEVISKPLDEIQRYGTTVAWLFDLVVSIFGKETDKQQYGVLWANTGINQKFEMQQTMTANLAAAICEYRLLQISSQSGKPGPFTVWKGFSLSRYWSSKQPVLAEKGERDQAYFSERVKQRDGYQCVISHVPCNLVTLHLIPNRLPHKTILMILQRQSGLRAVVPNDKWGKTGIDANNDERIAILAFGPL